MRIAGNTALLLLTLASSAMGASVIDSPWYEGLDWGKLTKIDCRYYKDYPPLTKIGDSFTIRIDQTNLDDHWDKALLVGISPHVVYEYEEGKYIKYGMLTSTAHIASQLPDWRILYLDSMRHFSYEWKAPGRTTVRESACSFRSRL